MTAQADTPLLRIPALPGAACYGLDTQVWYSRDADNIATARRICQGCPERQPCLAYAVTTGQRGMWGGTTEEERGMVPADIDHPLAPLVAAHPDWTATRIARLAGCDRSVVYRLRRKLAAAS